VTITITHFLTCNLYSPEKLVISALEFMVQNDRDLMGEILLYPRPMQSLQTLTLNLSLINDIAIILIIFLQTMYRI